MEAVTAIKSGTARSKHGAERDRGAVVHLVQPLPENSRGDWFTKALCGAEPGRRGNGWHKTTRAVTCLKCIKKKKVEEPVMVEMCLQTKICNKCSGDLPLGKFRRRKDSRRPGVKYYVGTCTDCEKKLSKGRYHEVKDDPQFRKLDRAKSKAYRKANADVLKVKRSLNYTNANPEFKAYRERYIAKNKAHIEKQEVVTRARYHTKNRDGLTDTYIIKLLVNNGYTKEQVLQNPNLIVERREKIKSQRLRLAKEKIEAQGLDACFRFLNMPPCYSNYSDVKIRVMFFVDEHMASAYIYAGEQFIKIDNIEIENIAIAA